MEFFVENINLVLFLPLIMCSIIGFNGLISNKVEKSTLFLMSIVSSFLCVVFAAFVFNYSVVNNLSVASNFPWITLDNLNFYIGTYLDKISVSFLLVLCIFSFALQIVSYVKLKDFFNYPKLLLLLNLFAFGLTGVFISPNLFQTYLFCEVTGVAGYLLINFDFSNREESKAGIKSFIYNRVGDLTLLFCVLTILYYSVVYNRLTDASALAYSNMNTISALVNSLLNNALFVIFCSMLIFVIVMKFMQAFIYITFENIDKGWLSRIIFYQNSFIGMIGLYLFLRLNPFFFELGTNWVWTLLVLSLVFIAFVFLNRLFMPFCKMIAWVEKYIVESIVNFTELVIRAVSYMCCKLQAGNFQSYLIYSIVGLVLILAFVLVFYEMLIKV